MVENTSEIGLGMAALGRPVYINVKQQEVGAFSLEEFKAKGMEVLDKAYELGVRFFDTSPGYGLAEKLLLDWLAMKNDPSISVATKWGYTYIANFDPNAKIHEIKEHSLAKLEMQWAVSKQLLPYLNYYQIHSATFETGVLQNKAVLERLFQLKNKHGIDIGITTTGPNQIEVVKMAMDIKYENVPLFDVFQATYNILDQSIFSLKKPLENEGKKLIIKETLANGRLIPNVAYGQYHDLYEYLNTLAKKYNVGADAIALRFCMDSFSRANVLSGASNETHIKANLKANTFSMTNDEIEILKSFAMDPQRYWQERKEMEWN